MAYDKKISVEVVEWCDYAEILLKKAITHCSIEDLKAQVANNAVLFRVMYGAVFVGYYILRVDELESGNEGVVVAAYGRCDDIDLTEYIVPLIEKQFINCTAMRIHTNRSGLIRKLAGLGYTPQEFVMRKNLT